MRIKALLALLGLVLALLLVAGCDDDNEDVGVITGTVTNASTGLAQGDATVTLLQNGTVIATTQVSNEAGTLGQYTFTGVPIGGPYTVLVSSNAEPPAFADVQSLTFNVDEGTNVVNVTVGTGVTGDLSGTITNASTGLGQPNATVTLLQNGTVVATTLTNEQGQYSFIGITPGTGYTILVTSNEEPPAFPEVSSLSFTINTGSNTQNQTVGSGITGTTVSGSIGTVDPTATFTVSILSGTQVLASTTTGPAEVPQFSLTNVAPGNDYTIRVVNNTSGIITVFGPLDVPASGVSNVVVNTKSEEQLLAEGVPSNANLVAFIPQGGTITVGTKTSTSGNPTWLTNLSAGEVTVIVDPNVGETAQFVVPVSSTLPTVIRYNPN